MKVKTKVDKVKASMEEKYKVLIGVGAIFRIEVSNEEKREQGCFCQYNAACVGSGD